MRQKKQPDLMEVWQKQQDEYRRQIFGERKPDNWSLYAIGTRPNKNGYNLYSY